MPKKMCRQVGCSELIEYSKAYCSKHTRNNDRAATNKHYDKTRRNQAMNRFYHSSQWKKLRQLQLRDKPLCVICQEPGEVADHIKEISDGGCATCLDNLQTLCIPCHNTKTSQAAKARKNQG